MCSTTYYDIESKYVVDVDNAFEYLYVVLTVF
jgi:hypothetical protein